MCVCVYSVSREHDYDLQQLLSLSEQAVVLYHITFIIFPFLELDKCREIGIKLVMVSASIPLSFAQVG